MTREPVVSSSIVVVAYCSEREVLEVEFVGGRVYEYLGVPGSVYRGLVAADSKGRFVNLAIKGHYAFRRVGVRQ